MIGRQAKRKQESESFKPRKDRDQKDFYAQAAQAESQLRQHTKRNQRRAFPEHAGERFDIVLYASHRGAEVNQ